MIYIYNNGDQAHVRGKTINTHLYTENINTHTIILGDFNLHHPLWEADSIESNESKRLVDWMEQHKVELLNKPGEGTFFRPHMDRDTVINLTLATSSMARKIYDWQVIADLGSDHKGILFSIKGDERLKERVIPNHPRFNIKKADWSKFALNLQSLAMKSHILNSEQLDDMLDSTLESKLISDYQDCRLDLLDAAALSLTNIITQAAKSSIPTVQTSTRAKPWWNTELKEMRKLMVRAQKQMKSNPGIATAKEAYIKNRNSYFSAIKKAKHDHWNRFLAKEDAKSIFKAMSYTKDTSASRIPATKDSNEVQENTFEGKCRVLKSTLFPPPPVTEEISWQNY